MNEHEKAVAAKERADLEELIRRNGTDLAKICERKGLTHQLIVAQQKGYWSC